MTEPIEEQAPAPEASPDKVPKAGLMAKASEEAVKVLVGGILGGAIAIGTPLRDVISAFVWTDKPHIELQLPSQKIFAGDKFDLRIVVQQTNPAPIAGGVLFITGSESIVVPPASRSIQIEKSEHAVVVPKDDKAIQLQAKSPGSGKLSVELRRRSGEVVSRVERTIDIDKLEDRGYVSAENLSGVWKFSIGLESDGKLFLSEPKRGELVGRYEFGGKRGSLVGNRDGTGDFNVFLSRSDSPQRWKVVGKLIADGQFLKISGSAIEQRGVRDAWTNMKTGSGVSFKASASTAE